MKYKLVHMVISIYERNLHDISKNFKNTLIFMVKCYLKILAMAYFFTFFKK